MAHAFGSCELVFDQLGRPLALSGENKCGNPDFELVIVT
jgi:hypothetical protein